MSDFFFSKKKEINCSIISGMILKVYKELQKCKIHWNRIKEKIPKSDIISYLNYKNIIEFQTRNHLLN